MPKKLIKKAVADANKEQKALVERYDKKFGGLRTNGCKASS
jgi:hypothetical protein